MIMVTLTWLILAPVQLQGKQLVYQPPPPHPQQQGYQIYQLAQGYLNFQILMIMVTLTELILAPVQLQGKQLNVQSK